MWAIIRQTQDGRSFKHYFPQEALALLQHWRRGLRCSKVSPQYRMQPGQVLQNLALVFHGMECVWYNTGIWSVVLAF